MAKQRRERGSRGARGEPALSSSADLGRRGGDLGSFLLADLRPRDPDTAESPPLDAPLGLSPPPGTLPRTNEPAHDDGDDDDDQRSLPGLPAPLPLIPTGAWAVSLFVHLGVAGGAALLVARMAGSAPAVPLTPTGPSRETAETTLEIELPPLVRPSPLRDARAPKPADSSSVPHASGAQPAARPDTRDPGQGGTREASAQAINLAARADTIAIDKDPQSRLDRSQVQRLKSADDRASLDDRRATLQPMEVTFLASGDGHAQVRRTLAEADPSRGALEAAPAAVLGATLGAAPLPPGEGEQRRDPGSEKLGTARQSPGVGLLGGREGTAHHAAADAAFARPWITEGRPAVPADRQDRTRDTVDSVQEVASADQALLLASTAGGDKGKGLGGEEGPGRPAAGGGVGVGTKTLVLGQGTGPLVDLDGNDPRLSDYRRRVMAKIHPLWGDAFPRWAALEGRQGRAIIALTINTDGSVANVSISRPSGVAEFDENVRKAVLKAAPFPPLPPELSARSMRWAIAFDAKNPVVR